MHVPNDLTAAQRLADIGQSLAETMHDLRGPLTTIVGFADLMSLEGDADKRRAFFAEISRQVERLKRMSDDTLAFARGEQPLILRAVNLNALGSRIEEVLAREFCGTGIAPVLELRFRGRARLDVAQLLRVVENLARNSREAIARGGGTRFAVVVERCDDSLCFAFIDDGPGLPPEVRERAFTAFATAGKPGGTGLGLHVVQQIAHAHGGEARLVDVPRGTRVEVSVPWNAVC